MVDNQKVDNYRLGSYAAETKDQGGGIHRQVMEVGSIAASVTIPTSTVTVSAATVTEVTAGVASGTALAASASRLAASIFNKDTAESAYLNIGAAATTSKIQLRPGEWWHMSNYGAIFTEEITCIRGGASDVTLVVVSG